MSIGNQVLTDPSTRGTGTNLNSKSVSTFDLELNPFEQSFASTKKSSNGSNDGNGIRNVDVDVNTGLKQNLNGELGSGLNSSINTNEYGALQRPAVQPPAISPSGSKRLPSLLLSPGVMNQTSAFNVNTKKNGNIVRTPIFFMNSGLTPNESSLRTGLTPLSQNVPALLPLLNNTNNPNVPFTPGLTTLLGYSAAQQSPNTVGMLNGAQMLANVDMIPTSLNTTGTTAVSAQLNSLPKAAVSEADNGKSKRKHAMPDSIESYKNQFKTITDEKSGKKSKANKKKKKNNTNENSNKTDQQLNPKDENASEEVVKKRKEFLERNRLAASKFRQRKKEYIKKIETDLEYYEEEYNNLTGIVDQLLGTDGNSLLNDLKHSISTNESNKALELANKIQDLLTNSNYVKRGRVNLRKSDDSLRSDNDDI